MKKNGKRKIKVKRPVITVFCIIAIVFIIVNVARFIAADSDNGYKTEQVRMGTMQDTVDITGFAVRDEVCLKKETGGVVVPLVADGKRVAGGDSVARVFSNDNDAAAFSELEQEREKLEYYENAANEYGAASIDMEKLNTEVSEIFSSLSGRVSGGDFAGMYSELNELRERLLYKQMLVNDDLDLTGKITETQQNVAKLEAKNISARDIAAPRAGYYISSPDGYENAVAYEKVCDLNVSRAEKLLQEDRQKPEGGNGKIVSSFEWYIVTVIDSKYRKIIAEGDSLKVNVKNSGCDGVDVRVKSLGSDEDGKTVVVLSCNLMNEIFANIRKIEGELVIGEYTGLKVPNIALRTYDTTEDEMKKADKDSDGKTPAKPEELNTEQFSAVYIIRGKYMSVRRAEVLYTGEDYSIVKNRAYSIEKDGDYEPVRLYDDVVIKGRDLGDGKITY